MINKKIASALILLFVLASFFSISAEDYSAWQFSKQVYINTSALGLSSDVSNFPLLIRLNSSNFDFSEAQSDGDDIRFSQSDGTTPLDYEKEVWDNTGQVGEIWIKIPSVLANNSEQSIIMYWGNANASNASYGPNVFARSNDFTCVYHMTNKDDLDDASATPSTGEYDGSSNGTQNVNGIAGKAVDFEGADWIDIPSGIFSSISDQITIELWQYGDACQPQADRILWGSDYYGNRAINIILPWSDEYIVWDAGNSGGCFNRIEKYATGTFEYKGQWNHWVFTKNTGDGSMRMYLNGEEWLGESSGNTYTIQVYSVRIGADHYGCQNYDGYLDEFRFSKTVRSEDWIKLSYQTQKENQTVITFGETILPYVYPEVCGANENMKVDGNVIIGNITDPSEKLEVDGNVKCDGIVIGNVADPSEKLEVEGKIKCNAVVIGDWTLRTPDYVFDANFDLLSIEKLEAYLKDKKHLPGVPSAEQMKENGVDLSELNMILLRKIEEIHLYIVKQNKKIEKLSEEVDALKR